MRDTLLTFQDKGNTPIGGAGLAYRKKKIKVCYSLIGYNRQRYFNIEMDIISYT